MDTKTIITRRLTVLLGLELSGVNHVSDMLTLQFGRLRQITTRRGVVEPAGAWALHVPCDWHVEQSGDTVANQDDLRTDDMALRAMERLDGLLVRPIPAVVKKVKADASCGMWIDLSHDLRLVVAPHGAASAAGWRFFAPGEEEPHFAIAGGEIDPGSLPTLDAVAEQEPWWKRWLKG